MSARVREVLPEVGEVFDAGTDDGRARLRGIYAVPDAAFLRLNMITSLTGAAVGPDGTSDTLSSRTDRAVLRVIRDAADAVVVGAATVRAEGYVLPRRARLAVVTASGDLRGHRLTDPARVLLVCPESRVEAVRRRADLPDAEVVGVTGGDDLDPRAVRDTLAERGLRSLVCEGGPTLAGRFAAAGVIDEYCVTVAPILGPAEHPFVQLAADAAPETEPAGMLVDDAGFSYLRLRPRP